MTNTQDDNDQQPSIEKQKSGANQDPSENQDPAQFNPEEKIAELEAELNKAKSDFLYLRADFDNYKKAVLKERSDLMKYGVEHFVIELLDVLDNFERALSFEVTAENFPSFKEGMLMTQASMNKLLQRFNVSPIETIGKPFDPHQHEALAQEPTDEVPAGQILREFKKGYKLHDRLIRPAQVVVAKSTEASN